MLPVELISYMITFLDCPRTFMKVLCLSKNVKRYIETESYMDCVNIVFDISELHEMRKPYVLCIKCDLKTFKGIKYLKGIHTLNLCYNNNITDEGLKHLKGIHTLDLWTNTNITDDGLKYLKGIYELNLCYNYNITDEGLKHLKGIHTLDLYWNNNITKESIESLGDNLYRYNNGRLEDL